MPLQAKRRKLCSWSSTAVIGDRSVTSSYEAYRRTSGSSTMPAFARSPSVLTRRKSPASCAAKPDIHFLCSPIPRLRSFVVMICSMWPGDRMGPTFPVRLSFWSMPPARYAGSTSRRTSASEPRLKPCWRRPTPFPDADNRDLANCHSLTPFLSQWGGYPCSMAKGAVRCGKPRNLPHN